METFLGNRFTWGPCSNTMAATAPHPPASDSVDLGALDAGNYICNKYTAGVGALLVPDSTK